ncbi:MAG: MFS transporter [Bacteroidaceae bacterium]|nr:MFS transporter [Bacteroidaceae bacterium]
MKSQSPKHTSPWAWVPSLYFAEGIPYLMVMAIAAIMYKKLGLGNDEIALYTSWLYLPWVIKPLWSPIVDMFKTKRWWIVVMEFVIGVTIAGVALTIRAPQFVQYTMAFFWLMAFSSATHDIAADGFYMIGLDTNKQSLFVGIRSTFYRISMIAGQGLTLILAGTLERNLGDEPLAWTYTMATVAVVFILIFLYHAIMLPRVEKKKQENSLPTSEEKTKTSPSQFLSVFKEFFTKQGVWIAIVFMLLYRFPEALLTKIAPLFLIDEAVDGGLELSTDAVGIAQGTVGVVGLTIGGILGGIAASRGGLKKWLWPMVWAITLPDIIYVFLSILMPSNIFVISAAIFVEQFGYGFGFTAYMLFMLYFCQTDNSQEPRAKSQESKARGANNQTSHYAICTGFMALSMMLPGMVAGYLQQWLGYTAFFILVMVCCLLTVVVARIVKIDPQFGVKNNNR